MQGQRNRYWTLLSKRCWFSIGLSNNRFDCHKDCGFLQWKITTLLSNDLSVVELSCLMPYLIVHLPRGAGVNWWKATRMKMKWSFSCGPGSTKHYQMIWLAASLIMYSLDPALAFLRLQHCPQYQGATARDSEQGPAVKAFPTQFYKLSNYIYY